MPRIKEHYDIVIIGSGLGGLLCGYLLAKEGKSVCILEKNAQIGGNLQTFKRDGVKFDSGVHYIGGLDPGQALYPFFRYFNLMDTVEKVKLDTDGYDLITFQDDANVYPHAQGYENFIQRLVHFFPEEESGIRRYCREIQETCRNFEWYNLQQVYGETDETGSFGLSAKSVIAQCTGNTRLQQILGGSNMLYAGDGDTSPFYIHALILDSYIGSAYKLRSSDQISKQLRKDLRAMGAGIVINSEVTRIENTAKQVLAVELASGQRVTADTYISNIHPSQTFRLINPEGIRRVNLNRMLHLPNTVSAFILYIKLKPGSHPYTHANRYHFFGEDVWNVHRYTADDWIKGLAVFNSPSRQDGRYAETLTVMAYMRYEEVKQWEHTFHTTLDENDRGQDYVDFKEERAQRIFDAMERFMPGIRAKVDGYYTATPLTQRDYIGSVDGGLYGIRRDFNAPLNSYISPKTKLENLFLTGQNVILHGVLGVTISAAVTCQHILGKDRVMRAIRKFC